VSLESLVSLVSLVSRVSRVSLVSLVSGGLLCLESLESLVSLVSLVSLESLVSLVSRVSRVCRGSLVSLVSLVPFSCFLSLDLSLYVSVLDSLSRSCALSCLPLRGPYFTLLPSLMYSAPQPNSLLLLSSPARRQQSMPASRGRARPPHSSLALHAPPFKASYE
jgi:hypothetical protein